MIAYSKYHFTLSMISKMMVLRTKRNCEDKIFSRFFMSYFDRGKVWVSGCRGVDRYLKSGHLEGKRGGANVLVPSAVFWDAENGDDFVRGDIFMESNALPPLAEFCESIEFRVLWNYGQVVPASSESWVKKALGCESPRFLIQSTNRIAGAEYLIVRSNNVGIVDLADDIFPLIKFDAWSSDLDEVGEAVKDSNLNWKSKWFVKDDSVFSTSLRLVSSRLKT